MHSNSTPPLIPGIASKQFMRYIQTSSLAIPYYTSHISAGFPSPADDYFDRSLDLNDLVIKHPEATFFVKVEGESMLDAGIHPGDTLVIDRALRPVGHQVIIAVIDGEFTVKRIEQRQERVFLVAANPTIEAFEISPDMDFHIWGVVTYVIHPIQ